MKTALCAAALLIVGLWLIGAGLFVGQDAPRAGSALYGAGMATVKLLLPAFLAWKYWRRTRTAAPQ